MLKVPQFQNIMRRNDLAKNILDGVPKSPFGWRRARTVQRLTIPTTSPYHQGARGNKDNDPNIANKDDCEFVIWFIKRGEREED